MSESEVTRYQRVRKQIEAERIVGLCRKDLADNGVLAVVEEVCAAHGVAVDVLLAPSQMPGVRIRRVAAARADAMHAVREFGRRRHETDRRFPPFTWKELGRMFGRDHTSCIYAVRQARSREQQIVPQESVA